MNMSNADNEWLGPLTTGRFVIGSVDQVNGRGAEEVPNFVPTRYELVQLAKHWAREDLEISWFWFVYGSTGSTETRVKSFARRRINRIAAVLGGDEVDKAIEEVHVLFREGLHDQTLWDIYCNGDESQWREVREQSWRIIESQDKTVPAKVQVAAKRQARKSRVRKPHDRVVIPTSINSEKDVTGVGDCEL